MPDQPCLHNEMVLRLTGGTRDGESIAVTTSKCLLQFTPSPTDSEPILAALFRGPQGVVLRGLHRQATVNGESKAVHWLRPNDRIQFPGSVSLEVDQLGATPVPIENRTHDSKLAQLEAKLAEIHDQNRTAENRFNELNNRLTQLSDQLARLVELSQGADAPSPPLRSSAPTLVDVVTTESAVETKNPDPQSGLNPKTVMSEPDPGFHSEPVSTPVPPQVDRDIPKRPVRIQDETIASEWAQIESLGASRLFSEPEPATAPPSVSAPLDEEAPASQVPEAQQPEAPKTESIEEMIARIQQQVEVETPVVAPQDAPDQPIVSELPAKSEPNIETPAASSEPNPEEGAHSEPPRNESVAELLERLKREGELDGVVEVEPATDVAPEPPTMIPEEATLSSTPETVKVVEPVGESSSTSAALDSDSDSDFCDVDSYMAQLLARMRGDDVTESEPEPEPSSSSLSEPEPAKQVEPVAKKQASAPVLKPEDFVPKQKPKKIESLDAMRELANVTARTAVRSSEENRQRALAYLQLALGVASIMMAGYYFLVQSESLFDTGFVIGLICLMATGVLGYRFHTTLKKAKQMFASKQPESRD